MTQENKMPGEIWLIDTASDPLPNGMYCAFDEPVEGVRDLCSYIRRAVTKEEAAMVAEYAKAQGQFLHPSSKLFGKQHRMKCWDIIERMAEAHK